MKYNIDTCPKPEDFFIRGGRCGWAHVCKECEQMVKPRLPKWAQEVSDKKRKRAGVTEDEPRRY